MAEWVRDVIAFWIFGLANNFGYVIMLSAAQDIILKQNVTSIGNNSSTAHSHCFEKSGNPRCSGGAMSTGAILMADILPALCIKFTFPFFMNRIPFGFRHFVVCSLQASSYLIVAFSNSIQMSLAGVVFASISSGLGELCYLALSAHYSNLSIAAWSSGTGGAGLIGAITYAVLTEPKLFDLSPRIALLLMLVVPAVFAVVYWTVLRPSPTVHKMCLWRPSTWIVPAEKEKYPAQSSSSSVAPASSSSVAATQSSSLSLAQSYRSAGEEDDQREKEGSGREEPLPIPMDTRTFTHEFTLLTKLRMVLPLLRYMIPLGIVYFAEYLINSGLHQLIHFDCAHGFFLDNASQFRWYQALYQLGVFISRSSVSFLELPPFGLYVLPMLQLANLVIFYFQALDRFIPHIFIVFLLILVEGLFGGAAYVNTFFRIHKEARAEVREFSLSIASSGDSLGISLSSVCSILLRNFICGLYPSRYPDP